jgi:hypothetical protein
MIDVCLMETAARPITITISKDLFDSLLFELNKRNIVLPKAPYTDGVVIDGVQIEWREE